MYNYYGPTYEPSSCALPSQGTNNNGNVMGYFYQDTTWNPTWDHTAAYTYDGVNRLLTAVTTPYSPGTISYNLTFNDTSKGEGYGAYGNMTCVMESNTVGLCPQWTFNSSTNQLSNSGFVYDAAGNMTSDISYGSPARNYAWDAEGRITTVTDNSGGHTGTTYVYNALGRRVEIKTSGWQVEQVFDPQGERIGYYSVASGNNQWLLAYVPFQGRELARYFETSSFEFTHANALGSAWITNDAADNLLEDALFYPWGQPWQIAGAVYDAHFAGMYAALQGPSLADFSMYDAPYRFYAPSPGRWHSPDPLGGGITNPQSLNGYAYVLDNPMSLIDSLGLYVAICDPWDATCEPCDSFIDPSCPVPPPGGGGVSGGGGGGTAGGGPPPTGNPGAPPSQLQLPPGCEILASGAVWCPPGSLPWSWVTAAGLAGGATGGYLIQAESSAQAPQVQQATKPGCFGVFLGTTARAWLIPSLSLSTGLTAASYGTVPAWSWAAGRSVGIRAGFNFFRVPAQSAALAARYAQLAALLEKANVYLQVASFAFAGYEGLSAEWDAAASGACQGVF